MAGLKIGIYGGTFDPPHVAHLILADEARRQMDLDRLLWVLTPDPPHKQDRVISPLADRLAMLHAALEPDPGFELSRIDIDRPPPQYAVDTMDLLRQQFPQSELIYLMGGDSLRDLPTWHRPLNFVAACDAIAVMRRPLAEIALPEVESALPGIGDKIRWIEAPLLEISGTEIRRRALAGESFRYYVPERVFEIIQDREVYRKGT